MKVTFWGVRGSIPAPATSSTIRRKLLRVLEHAQGKDLLTNELRNDFLDSLPTVDTSIIGGNTSCIQVSTDSNFVIFDMGTGLRELGRSIVKDAEKCKSISIFLSHTHWDHVQGFPFFLPAFRPESTINFFSPHEDLKKKLEAQQDFTFFPVSLEFMAAQKNFYQITTEEVTTVGDIEVSSIELHHPGKSFGFKASSNGKSVVYATDSEYNNITAKRFKKYIDFYFGADMLVFDAQYSFDQEIQKIDWGHSSALVGIDLAIRAGVRHLALFHHDPDNDDYEVERLLAIAKDYKQKNYSDIPLNIFIAREGLEVTV